MKSETLISEFWALTGLAYSLAFPSIGIIAKYFGTLCMFVYVPFVFFAIWMIHKYVAVWFQNLVSERIANWLLVATFVGLMATFFIVYPIANAQPPDRGSDADEALKIAAQELIHGRYPYYPKTYLNNPIAPMPGAVLLVTPFVLLGEGSLHNLFWLAAFFIVLRIYLKESRSTLLLLWTSLILCPAVVHNIVTGVDETSNAIYVFFFSLLLLKTVIKETSSSSAKTATAILLGVSLSSRGNFALLMLSVFYFLARQTNWVTAIKYATITGLALATVTIPFWLYDPSGFAPIYIQHTKVAQFQRVLPYSNILIPLSAVLLSVILCLKFLNDSLIRLFAACALVQAVLVLYVVTLSLILNRLFGLALTGYGVFVLPFSLFACGISLFNQNRKFDVL
ncbi:MAG TPA: hypothetical protein VEF04_09165 [Blastocatellia bacterium]|nr:hypothetical protein [Blastocatellia bacterium]